MASDGCSDLRVDDGRVSKSDEDEDDERCPHAGVLIIKYLSTNFLRFNSIAKYRLYTIFIRGLKG